MRIEVTRDELLLIRDALRSTADTLARNVSLRAAVPLDELLDKLPDGEPVVVTLGVATTRADDRELLAERRYEMMNGGL